MFLFSQVGKHLREDLQSWLATQISDGHDSDPFGYSIGTKQQRFGDDFDHERIARYEVCPPQICEIGYCYYKRLSDLSKCL